MTVGATILKLPQYYPCIGVFADRVDRVYWLQWSVVIVPEDEAKATPKSYHSIVMWGKEMCMFGGEASKVLYPMLATLIDHPCFRGRVMRCSL